MLNHTIDPVILQIGFLQIRYYGLFYIIGLFITYFLLQYLAKNRGLDLDKEQILDYITWLAIGTILGARLFYFIFYEPMILLKNPLEIIRIWNGGMSFHGGLIGAVIAVIIYCRKHNLNVMKMADITMIPIAIGLAIGRIGNFINGELYGRLWSGPLCIDYSNNPDLVRPPVGCRYPSQFVESFKNLVIFMSLWFVKDLKFKGKSLPDGALFYLFVFLYGVLRFFIEFIRQPDAQLGFVLGWMTMGQILCIIMIISGGLLLFKSFRGKLL